MSSVSRTVRNVFVTIAGQTPKRGPLQFVLLAVMSGCGSQTLPTAPIAVIDMSPAGKGTVAADFAVYTDPDDAGVEYLIQGEYLGSQTGLPALSFNDRIGLQVLAHGNGRFDAILYDGGLPGDGWWGGAYCILSGRGVGGVVELSGDGCRILIENGAAEICDASGQQAGCLTKVFRGSPTLNAPAPPGAIELYSDSTDTSLWRRAGTTDSGLLEPGCQTADAYADFRLHVEFRLPFMPSATGQARGNSGIYLQSRYEIQILDSFGLPGLANECGALYKTTPPAINMCLPPLQWQTYDIVFQAPRFDELGRKRRNARVSVWHNGILIHDDVEISDKTGSGEPEGPDPLPTVLQDHGDPVVFRNIWLLSLDESAPEGGAIA